MCLCFLFKISHIYVAVQPRADLLVYLGGPGPLLGDVPLPPGPVRGPEDFFRIPLQQPSQFLASMYLQKSKQCKTTPEDFFKIALQQLSISLVIAKKYKC